MRVFHCDDCGHPVRFDALDCPSCGVATGYEAGRRTTRALRTTTDPVVFHIDGDDRSWWRCLNAAWGCNWMVATESPTGWCRSCRLTRGRPDDARPDAVAAWTAAEAAKRRLVHQLDELGLPIDMRSDGVADGLAFDLVHLPGEGGITGHLDGVVTLDLAETDDRHRDDLRRRLGEPFRTVIGHLRHEIAHHYWGRLVGQSDDLEQFRRLFGDERVDYARAVERHYAEATASWDERRFVTGYAAAHPMEDWAETFAHYLHLVDVVDTAAAHGFAPSPDDGGITTVTAPDHELDELLTAWRPVNAGVNAIAESLGVPTVYPFDPADVVVEKLEFVHRQIRSHAARGRFYADR